MGKRMKCALHIVAVAAMTLAAVLTPMSGALAAAPARPGVGVRAPADDVGAGLLAAATTWNSQGAVVTQTFALHGGWNTIYLEVEPINPAPIVDPDGAGPLLPAPALASLEAIFAQLAPCACLESVWTWNVPTTQVDYIVDPAEGLWDEPGWKQYIPAGKPDAFLTDLLSLHANTGYLVQLQEGANATLTVSGSPVVRQHRWVQQSYNLAGFPILAGHEPTRAAFFGASPITEVFALSAGGEWLPLPPTATLAAGEAYLVYYDGPNPAADTDYTAPLILEDVPAAGLHFGSGAYRQSFMLRSLAPGATPVTVALLQGGGAGVALQLTAPVTQSLPSGAATVNLPAGGAQMLEFAVLTNDQPQDGAALIQISAPAVGVRWLVPVTAKAGSKAGLWVGEVTVTAVSEARLGATNVASDTLTFGLHARSDANISGAAELHQAGAALQVTITLALPNAGSTTPLDPARVATSTAPAVGGYVFWDANQNGQRDGDEVGLAGLDVTLGSTSVKTAADGAYLFAGAPPGSHEIAVTPPANYTADFLVTLPVTPAVTIPNVLPTALLLSAAGIDGVSPPAYVRQALLVTDTLPYYDEDDNRIEPAINFGLAPLHVAELVATGNGGCADVQAVPAPVLLGNVVNGFLGNASIPDTQLTNLLQGAYAIRVRAGDQEVACGELHEAASTQEPFRFRILLRVQGADAKPELLPYYEVVTDTQRISTVNFSIPAPKTTTGGTFRAGGVQQFEVIDVAANDPLNPFKHKYHPDHDNLDGSFLPLPGNAPPYLWEAPAFTRRIQLTLLDNLGEMPGMDGLSADELHDLVVEIDWGGAAWGGRYKEVISGVHKNDITVEGAFVIRQVLTGDQLRKQPFDQ